MQRIEVEVLTTETCPSRRTAADAVRRVASEAGLEVTLSERIVATQEEAEALRMPGSPTVRVAGRDVQPRVEGHDDFGLG